MSVLALSDPCPQRNCCAPACLYTQHPRSLWERDQPCSTLCIMALFQETPSNRPASTAITQLCTEQEVTSALLTNQGCFMRISQGADHVSSYYLHSSGAGTRCLRAKAQNSPSFSACNHPHRPQPHSPLLLQSLPVHPRACCALPLMVNRTGTEQTSKMSTVFPKIS